MSQVFWWAWDSMIGFDEEHILRTWSHMMWSLRAPLFSKGLQIFACKSLKLCLLCEIPSVFVSHKFSLLSSPWIDGFHALVEFTVICRWKQTYSYCSKKELFIKYWNFIFKPPLYYLFLFYLYLKQFESNFFFSPWKRLIIKTNKIVLGWDIYFVLGFLFSLALGMYILFSMDGAREEQGFHFKMMPLWLLKFYEVFTLAVQKVFNFTLWPLM